jgi:hypothetical protein
MRHRPPWRGRAQPAHAPQHDSGAPPTDSTREPRRQTQSTATRNARNRPLTRNHCPSRFDRLPHPLGLPLPIENFAL